MEMVLFQEDWDKYPQYVVDLKCPNPYFLRFCSTLKAMGIKNLMKRIQEEFPDLKYGYFNPSMERISGNFEIIHENKSGFQNCGAHGYT